MLNRIRQSMQLPLARPPGRRFLGARFAPEICAVIVLAVWAAAALWLGRAGPAGGQLLVRAGILPASDLAPLYWSPWRPALAAAWAAAGLVLVLVPMGFAAATLAAERERGTLESLFLAGGDVGLLARGRFLNAVTPWLRLALYLLPVYFLAGLDDLHPFLGRRLLWEQNDLFAYGAAPWSHAWIGSLQKIFRPAVESAHAAPWSRVTVAAGDVEGFSVAGLRWVNDVTTMLLLAAVAFRVSSRAPGIRAAVMRSWMWLPVVLLVAFSPDFWWTLLAAIRGAYLKSYWAVAAAVMFLRLPAAILLVRKVEQSWERSVERGEPAR